MESRIVERHDYGRTNIVEQLEFLEDFLNRNLAGDPGRVNLWDNAGTAGVTLGYRLDSDAAATQPATRAAATLACDLHTLWFIAASLPENTTTTATLAGHPFTIHATPANAFLNYGSWITQWSWSHLSRSEQAAQAVHAHSERYYSGGGIHSISDYIPSLHSGLRHLGDPAHPWADDLAIARDLATDPMKEDKSKATFLDLPLTDLLLAINDGDQDRYTTTLVTALEGHRRYWSQTRDRKQDPDGYTALSIAAACTIAHDHGLTTDVESDYLPIGLITPGWYPTTI